MKNKHNKWYIFKSCFTVKRKDNQKRQRIREWRKRAVTCMSEHTRDCKEWEITVLEVGRTWGREILVGGGGRWGQRPRGPCRRRGLPTLAGGRLGGAAVSSLLACTVWRGDVALLSLLVCVGVVVCETRAGLVASAAYCKATTGPTLLTPLPTARMQPYRTCNNTRALLSPFQIKNCLPKYGSALEKINLK